MSVRFLDWRLLDSGQRHGIEAHTFIMRRTKLSRAARCLADSLSALCMFGQRIARTAVMVGALAASTLGASPVHAQPWATPAFTEPASPARIEREQPFQARLQNLSDGDSFVVRAEDGRRVTVRLSAIDAPEKVQAHGDSSRRALLALLDKQLLTIIPIKRDPYGRTVAKVLVGELDVGLEQVRVGMAWHYRRYESEQSPQDRRDYATAERRARAERLGLWADEQPTPPWRYREEQRRGQKMSLSGLMRRLA